MVTLEDVKHAQARITPHVRRTPLIEARLVKNPITDATLYLKLECLQVSGSFKARGAVNKLLSLSPDQTARGIVTASGGNHGLGVAYAGWLAQSPATIYLPSNAPKSKAHKLESWGARVIYEGAVWDHANREALRVAEHDGLVYFHPFADPAVIAGQGTISLELFEDMPTLDTILVAIGGGGLISGVSLAAKALNPNLRIIGVEPVGAPNLYESRKQGQLVELPAINTVANTLAPLKSAQINFDIIEANVDDLVLVTDEQMREAARWLWFELGIAAELSGAAAVAALLAGQVQTRPGQKICALVCGAGTDGMS